MSIYDGVVKLAENSIPVIVELVDHHVRLSASGTEIGDWSADECSIAHVGDTVFTITAEDETLEFVPNKPRLFAAAIDGANGATTAQPPTPEAKPVPQEGVSEAPPAQPLTMGLFYALCLATAAMAIWSLVSVVF